MVPANCEELSHHTRRPPSLLPLKVRASHGHHGILNPGHQTFEALQSAFRHPPCLLAFPRLNKH
ncbi:hypothetical protein BX666DRAFT_2009879 [Dichotomocladium elegans]|nr:hypothetical protein BX666DRAFT_2009879 [Dichotomocladium elegans]